MTWLKGSKLDQLPNLLYESKMETISNRKYVSYFKPSLKLGFLNKKKHVGLMWQFLSKPGARLLKDLQLVGLLYAISFAQSEGSWPSRPVQLCCRPKAKYLSNKTGAVRKQHHMLVIRGGPSSVSISL